MLHKAIFNVFAIASFFGLASSELLAQSLQEATNFQLISEVGRRLGVTLPTGGSDSALVTVSCIGEDLTITATTASADKTIVWPMRAASYCEDNLEQIGQSFTIRQLKIIAACQGSILKRAVLSESGMREMASINYGGASSCEYERSKINAAR